MIENRTGVSATLEPHETASYNPQWAGNDLVTDQVENGIKHILIVEDEEAIRVWLRLMLELEGYRVTEACNGSEALDLFHAGAFDLVITDLEMPVMQGNKLAVGIKLLAPSVPILMVTGSERACRDARNPVDFLMSKPFTAADLRCVLGKLWSTRTGPANPASFPICAVPA